MKIDLNTMDFMTVVIPLNASKREVFAANELKKYIMKISRVEIVIAKDNEVISGFNVLIGNPKRNKIVASHINSEKFDALVPGPEGLMIKAYGENVLVLAGSDGNVNERERGTVYAVYEFLERFLGFSFVGYGKPGSKIGEYIPKNKEIDIFGIEYIKPKADLPYRASIIQNDGYAHEIPNSDADHPLTISIIDWMSKNRLNRIVTPLKSYEQLCKNGIIEEIIRRGISLTVGHHDSGMFFLPPEGNDFFKTKYYEKHKEFYKLTKETGRFLPASKWEGQLIFDLRNPDCIKQISININAWLDDNPYVDVVNIWPNDGDSEQCECGACFGHSKMTNYSYFINEIAKLVANKHPDAKIDMIAYLDLWEPPEGIKFSDNVIIEVATWGPNKQLRKFGANDGLGLLGTIYESNAKAWSKIASNVVYYDYYMTNFRSKQVYCPMADEILKIYENFKETNYCKGTGTQIESFNLWNYMFNFYTHGRKSYDTKLTMVDLLERFVKIFGKGSEMITEYINYIEDFYNGQVEEGNDGRSCASWFAKNVDKERVYGYFEKAFDAENHENTRDNIRALRMAFRYSDLITNDPDNQEILFISKNFGSYWGRLGQMGIGISSFIEPCNCNFTPDKWYAFSYI
jgi:hypothetical protein